MKSTEAYGNSGISGVGRTFTNACLKSCRKILAQIEGAKGVIVAEWRDTLKTHRQMLKLALNEAEALAWQTPYPHLVFPTLAMEKVQEVAVWQNHQQWVRRTSGALARPALNTF